MQRVSLEELRGLGSGGFAQALPSSNSSNESGASSDLPPSLRCILQAVQRDIGFQEEESDSISSQELNRIIDRTADKLGFELASYERDQILAQLEKNARPFGVLQELVDNPDVSDIIVSDFGTVAVQKGRKTFKTDVRFSSEEEYESFVEKLLQKAGSTYSTKKPVADGMIGSFARIHVVHKSLCDTGPYLTIRLNRFGTVTTQDLVKFGLAPQSILDYLAQMVKVGSTLMIIGEVGTGKTTLARAICSSIPPHESILVIEDTPEIRLQHPQVRYLTTREANTDGAGRVSPAECIRAGMRMAMNRIIFGEIRDAEAAESFIDVCSSGHPGLSTVHAKSASEAITRLELFLGRAQKGVTQNVVQQQIATAVQVLVFVNICPHTGRRRIMEVKEVGGASDGNLRQREIFRYEATNGLPRWKVVNRVSSFREELERAGGTCTLHQLGSFVELDESTSFREAATQGRR